MSIGRTKWQLRLAVAAALFGICLIVRLATIEKYRGRSLQGWVCPNAADSWGPDTLRSFHSNSVAAFREAGSDGVRLLLNELACERSAANQWRYARALEIQSSWPRLAAELYFGRHPGSPLDRVMGASHILDQLPLDERNLAVLEHFMDARKPFDAFPKGIMPGQDLSDKVRLGGLANALVRTGPTGIRTVSEALAGVKHPEAARLLLWALGRAGTNAAVAVAGVTALVGNTNLQADAIVTLMKIQGEASVPVLLNAVTNGNAAVLTTIGEYGREVDLLPHLLTLITNADPQVSFQAEIAVRKIRGAP